MLIGLVDSTRVGIMGWSYGGYISLMSMMKASDTFAISVSGAPVTFWEGMIEYYFIDDNYCLLILFSSIN